MRYLIMVIVLSFGLSLSGCDWIKRKFMGSTVEAGVEAGAEFTKEQYEELLKKYNNLESENISLQKQLNSQGKLGSDAQKDLEILKSLISNKPEDQVGAM